VELRHLRYFVAVAEERHFGRAAERLHIAQPPLSLQIKQLEADLGVQLLIRSTRKAELTSAGARYLERARAILASVDTAGAEASGVAGGAIGRLASGFTGSATYQLLPRLARVLREDFPGMTWT
jgi:DNA-binding transcriptional LysR family regulator